jgi:hydroxyacylglutathione hydrolase
MLLRYFYNQQLAHASYLVGCQVTGEAIVIDPGRDIEPYMATARAEGLWLAATTETHIHADFVSGARELAEQAKVKLYLSDEGDADWKYQYLQDYPHTLLKQGDTFNIGNIRFEVRHTPGHTPEHISLLITDTNGANQPMGMFTGDFVFVGDVGRPDLLEKAAGVANTAEIAARQMFHSLQDFKTLPDYLQVWPAHGAGSACGKALGAVPSSTVGYEKMFNPALSYGDEATFARTLLEGQPEPPRYFARMKRLNKIGPPVLRDLPRPEHLPFNRLDALLANGATLVDTRPAAAFATAHLPGAINIPHDNSFTNWAGWLLSYDQPFYLIADTPAVPQIVRDLLYIGLDNIGGYFDLSVLDAWRKAGDPLHHYEVATPDQIGDQVAAEQITVVDVRQNDEWQTGHIPGARHIMLGYLPERLAEIPADKPVVVQCRSGARSAIAASLLQAWGMPRVINLLGGIKAWEAAGLPVEH